MPNNCLFKVGDIVVFDCDRRKEIYIAQVTQPHINKWDKKGGPKITEATTEQKQKWYESGKDELIIERKDPPKFMGVGFEIDGL